MPKSDAMSISPSLECTTATDPQNDTDSVSRGDCPSCYETVETRTTTFTIPHFKRTAIETTDCHACGYKWKQLKPDGEVSPFGRKITFEVNQRADLNRTLLRSESCSLMIPEMQLDLSALGVLGAQVVTIKVLFEEFRSGVVRLSVPLEDVFGNGRMEERQEIFDELLAKLDKVENVESPFTLILDDPLGNSHLQNIFAPDSDPCMTIETYERTAEQNEEFGFSVVEDLEMGTSSDDKSSVSSSSDGEWDDGWETTSEPVEVPQILKSATMEAFAEFILANKCDNIVVLTGAGISTAAGIPDFRTPGTGLYSNLEKYNLPTPQSVFDIDYFRKNPKPFFLLAKELYPGNFKPTISHYFIKLLNEQGILLRNFTQNIDTLERVAGIDEYSLVESHGSFGSASCVGHFLKPREFAEQDTQLRPRPLQFVPPCGRKFTQAWVKERVFADVIPMCPDCEGIVKPDITFFGEPLPPRFKERIADLRHADALIVMGSSLKVQPFALLPSFVEDNVPRLLINKEVVGDFDAGTGTDALFLGTADDGCLRLAELLGLKDDLMKLKRVGDAQFDRQKTREGRMRIQK
ncbi:NAD-dependent protein deacetylase sirtuin-2 [Podochytrium sp. JEL0797]|nr:NAD-dependent protein deacetylase sirtuin-2 [Podochytrium sp. JEL0797]